MAVQILLNQAAKPAGIPGQAREDIDLAVPVQIQVVGGPFAKVLWMIRDRPIDYTVPKQSSAIVTAPTAPSTTVTGDDVAGTILLAVAVDAGFGLGAREEDNATITFYAGPPLGPIGVLPVRNPAFGEKKEHNVPVPGLFGQNPRGWALALDFWHALLTTFVPPPPIPDVIVANTAALTALAVGTFFAGQVAWVQSLDAEWRWSPTPLGVADGITLIPDSAAGQWWRAPSLSERWAKQASWFVDNAGGNDENDGATGGTALRTAVEVYRRLAPFGTWHPIVQTTVSFVPFAGSYACPPTRYAMERAGIEFVTLFGGVVLDQWAAVTPRVPATQTLPLAQSVGTPLVPGDLVNLVTTGARVWAPVVTQVADAFHLRMGAAWNIATGLPDLTPEPAVNDFFGAPILASIVLLGVHESTGPLKMSISTMEVKTLFTFTSELKNFYLNACRVFNVQLDRCQIGGCYLTQLTLRACRVQCSGFKEVNITDDPSATILLAGNVAGSSTAPSSLGFAVGTSGNLQIGNPVACDFNVLSPVCFVSRTGRVLLSAVDSFFGSAGWSFQVASTGPTIEKIPTAIGAGFIGTSGVDFTYAGFADLWFPPLPAGGGAVPAAASVPTWAVLNAAPFLGYAQQILSETRFRDTT